MNLCINEFLILIREFYFSFLYTILADKAFSGLSVLILCNKQDETFAKSQSVVESLLEKEM